MLLARWSFRLVSDVVMYGFANRSPAMSFGILALLVVGLALVGAQVSAPFIYTLF